MMNPWPPSHSTSFFLIVLYQSGREGASFGILFQTNRPLTEERVLAEALPTVDTPSTDALVESAHDLEADLEEFVTPAEAVFVESIELLNHEPIDIDDDNEILLYHFRFCYQLSYLFLMLHYHL